MRRPVVCVFFCQFSVLNHQQIFRVLFLRRLREIEGAGDYRLPVDDHDLVVSNRVLRVNELRTN